MQLKFRPIHLSIIVDGGLASAKTLVASDRKFNSDLVDQCVDTLKDPESPVALILDSVEVLSKLIRGV